MARLPKKIKADYTFLNITKGFKKLNKVLKTRDSHELQVPIVIYGRLDEPYDGEGNAGQEWTVEVDRVEYVEHYQKPGGRLRKGQEMYLFLQYLKQEIGISGNQNSRMADPFNISDEHFDEHWKNFHKWLEKVTTP